MKYRQWKKNYKKRYGVNPPPEIDKRKRRKQAARALNALAYADLIKAAEKGDRYNYKCDCRVYAGVGERLRYGGDGF